MGRLVTGGVCTYEQRERKESYKLILVVVTSLTHSSVGSSFFNNPS